MNAKTNSRKWSRIPLNEGRAARTTMLLLLLLTLPTVVQAQFTYTINNGTATITGYYGPGGAETIPSTINGLPVTSIGDFAFELCSSLTSITIPDSVTSIGGAAFSGCRSLSRVTMSDSVASLADLVFNYCWSLTSITIPASVTSIGDSAFYDCHSLTSITIPNGVTNIGGGAFFDCSRVTNVTIPNSVTSIGGSTFCNCSSLTNLTIGNSVTSIGMYAFEACGFTNITIPKSVSNIGDYAFQGCGACKQLRAVYFKGNAPSLGGTNVFLDANNVTVYYLPGTTGWSATYGGRPAVLWNPQVQTGDPSFGVLSSQFGFMITGTGNIPILVEAVTNLANASWTSLQSCTLTNGSIYFSDPQWTNYPGRFYRIRSP